MKESGLNSSIIAYKKQLDIGEIQVAYTQLVKFVMALKTRFSNTLGDQFSFGGIFQGYMDYTYFYFTNDDCRKRKLKFGLVLNHEKIQFEIWLLGQTKSVQEHYWNLLKSTEWIQGETIPKYSIFEHILIENPDFDDLSTLSETIEQRTVKTTDKILASLNHIEAVETPE